MEHVEYVNWLERMIVGCDEIGGMEREKAIYQNCLKTARALFSMPNNKEGILSIGTSVVIKNDVNEYKDAANTNKVVTGYRKWLNNDFGGYELDNIKDEIWLNEDFSKIKTHK